MTLYETTKLLWDLTRPAPFRNKELIELLRNNSDQVFNRYDLTEEEKDAVAKGDLSRLFKMGVHPRIMYRTGKFYGVKTAEEYLDRIK